MFPVVVRGIRPGLAVLAAAAGVLVTAAGCSSAGSSSTAAASAAPSPSPTIATAPAASGAVGSGAAGALPTALMTPLAAASGQLTGTQLQSVLLPAADFPAGYATSTSAPITSGGSLTAGKAAYNLATVPCATFIEHLGTTGFGETAMVAGSVVATGTAFDELIYQFAVPAGATAFVSGVQSLAGRCGSFKVSANGQAGTFTLTALPGSAVGGHPTVELAETGTLGTSKVTLDLLLCASGVDVFGVSGVGVSGAAAPTVPAKASIVYQLMKRQAAVAVLG